MAGVCRVLECGRMADSNVREEVGWLGIYRSPARGYLSRLACRYRTVTVAAALFIGDLVAAWASISSEAFFIGLTGLKAAAAQLATATLLVPALALAGLYDRSGRCPYERFRQRTFGIAGFVALVSFFDLPTVHPIDVFAVKVWEAVSLLVFGHYVEAATRSLLIRMDLWGASTVLVGSERACRRLAHLLIGRPELGFTPVGIVAGAEVHAEQGADPSLPVIGTTSDIRAIRAPTAIEVAIFASARELADISNDCPAFRPSCRFLLAENVCEVQSLWLRARTLGPLVGLEIRRDLSRWYNRALKRAFDLALAIPMGLIAAPIVAIAALAIKLVDSGPAFYVQDRVGRNGYRLPVLKLRTMYVDSERRLQEHLRRNVQAQAEWRRFFKLKHDPRILPVIGSFMRRASLDELPQLWNVIRGDMSLVGPRPLPAYHAKKLGSELRALRQRVTPGITGLWQVSSRSNGDLRVLKEMDLFYIRNWSLWLDVYILLETLPAVLSAKGAR
jgi:Undecaprenyl-phosphate galactose phosphotransferase WbaP